MEVRFQLVPYDPCHYCAPSGELTARIAYTNFNGTDALANAPVAGFPTVADGEMFLRQHCLPLVEGVEAVKKWVLTHAVMN